MLNSTELERIEQEIYSVHNCQNATNCWHFNIYKLNKYNICVFYKANNLLFFQYFMLSGAEHEKFHNLRARVQIIHLKVPQSAEHVIFSFFHIKTNNP